jgi:hypothetical protein
MTRELTPMNKPVSLREILEALELQTPESETYFDRETGEILMVTDDDRSELENEDGAEAPEWQREHLAKLRGLLDTERLVMLPSLFDIHEWAIMERFSGSVAKPSVRDELDNAIHGSGAFRMFRSVIERRGLKEEWQAFRQEAFGEIAREWLEENSIPYEK